MYAGHRTERMNLVSYLHDIGHPRFIVASCDRSYLKLTFVREGALIPFYFGR